MIPGKIGFEVLRNLSQYEYKGAVYPITPRGGEILGLKCYSSILETPGPVDLAVFTLQSKLILPLIGECGKKGVKNIVIISGGFKEVDEKSAEVERKVVKVAHDYGMRIIGPNCIGIFDAESRLDTFFQSHDRMLRPKLGHAAFISQSGTFGCAMLEWTADSAVGINKFVSYGNRCDVDEADLIRYFGEDPEIRVIAAYLESIGDGRKLLEAIKEVLPSKPIVILKAGRTDLGSKAALSHTGNLAGSYVISQTAFRQVGCILANNIEEFFDIVKAFTMQPLARGKRVAMVSNGAGPCVMAIDACKELGLEVGGYSDRTVEKLREELPQHALVGLIVDLTGSATSRDYGVAMEALLGDPQVDLLMPFFVFQDTPLDEDIVEVLPKLKRYGKPIICGASGGPYTLKQSRILEDKDIPIYPTPERTVAAANALVSYGALKRTPHKGITEPTVHLESSKRKVSKAFERVKLERRGVLMEHESKEVLRAYLIPTTREKVAKAAEEAVSFAEDIGYPVVLKVCSPQITHKSEAGGVIIGLKTSEEVSAAFREVMENARKYSPNVEVVGVSVQNMAPPGQEVIVGMIKDAQFGSVLMFGLGGVFAEVLKDVAFRLAPLSRADALEMIREVKGFEILNGLRGREPADLNAIVDTLLKVSKLVEGFPAIREMDINPVLVYRKGAVAVDARIMLE